MDAGCPNFPGAKLLEGLPTLICNGSCAILSRPATGSTGKNERAFKPEALMSGGPQPTFRNERSKGLICDPRGIRCVRDALAQPIHHWAHVGNATP